MLFECEIRFTDNKENTVQYWVEATKQKQNESSTKRIRTQDGGTH
jgi:hypothetical protein